MSVALTTLEQARAAADRVGDRVVRTPTTPARVLSDRFGATVFLKRELEQRTGSFKVRGSFNAALTMPASSLAAGLLAFSAGNHAMAVAHVGATLGVPVTVCMPAHAVVRKIDATRALGAEVVLVESDLVGTANRLAAERGLTLLHPFDDPAVVAGHAGVGLELVADVPNVDLVLVPVGGGGLISGVATAVKRLVPTARVIGVEPETSDVVSLSLAAGHPSTLAAPRSIADGLTAPITGDVPFAHIQSFVDSVVRVPDEAILAALGTLVREEGIPAEPAAAAGLAALETGLVPVPAGATVALVISGGNVAPDLLAQVS
jgi:threonine dehydratase